MSMDRVQVLQAAPNQLNRPDQPWYVTIEGDSIVAYWKWMDATFFAPAEVTNEVKEYFFQVTLNDKGKWHEKDQTSESSVSVSPLSIGISKGGFQGHMTEKAFTMGVGQNNQTGEAGIIRFKFDTAIVKNPIRQYLTNCGWKKALFG